MADPQQSLTHFFQTRFLLWAIRWVIGFGLIWLVVAYYPEYSWLWWVGGVVATLSLILMAISYFILNRKIHALTDRIERAYEDERLAEESEGEMSEAEMGERGEDGGSPPRA